MQNVSLFLRNTSQKSKYLLIGALILSTCIGGVWFGRASTLQAAPSPTLGPDSGLVVRQDGGMTVLQGLNCDQISLAGANSLYLANIRFVPGLADKRTETSATYDPETDCLHIGIVADRGGAGALAGPALEYTLDCTSGSIAACTSTPYEGETLELEESQMISLGKLTLELLRLCQSGQEVYRYWGDSVTSP